MKSGRLFGKRTPRHGRDATIPGKRMRTEKKSNTKKKGRKQETMWFVRRGKNNHKWVKRNIPLREEGRRAKKRGSDTITIPCTTMMTCKEVEVTMADAAGERKDPYERDRARGGGKEYKGRERIWCL